MPYIERQSGQVVTPTHWLRGNTVTSTALSLPEEGDEQFDVHIGEPAAPGWTPASLFNGVFYLCDAN